MFQFHSYSHRFARFKETRPASYAKGPAFACIAWIPFAKSVAALPPCEYQKHEYARKFLGTKSVFDLVFLSGNRTPTAKFGSREKFLTSLGAKDFRGALAIDNVSAALSAEGEFMGVDFDYFAEAGFTPFRLQPESKVSYFCPGTSDESFYVIENAFGFGKQGSDNRYKCVCLLRMCWTTRREFLSATIDVPLLIAHSPPSSKPSNLWHRLRRRP